MPLTVSIKETREGVFLITPVGSLDTNTYASFEQEIGPLLAAARALILDLAGLAYISSMGLRAFAKTKMTLEARGGSFLLVNPQPQVKIVFDTVRVLSDNLLASLEQADTLLDRFLDKVQKGEIKPRRPLA